jgi:multiple sugar transport system permease protein
MSGTAPGLAGRRRARRGDDRRLVGVRLRRARSAVVPYLFVAPVILFLGALLVYPVVLNIVMSFQDRELGNLVSGPAKWVGTQNYDAIFHDRVFKSAVVHSVLYTVVSVVIQLVIALALALFYSRRFRGARVFRSLFLVSYAIPIVVSAQVFKWLLDGRGMVNSVLHTLHLQDQPQYWLSDTRLALAAVIVVQLWLGVPFTMVNLLAGLSAIPGELHEAAAIDGANAWRRFWDITWPLLRPTVAAATILSLIFAFKNFDLIWIATKGGPANATTTLPVLAYQTAFEQFLFGRGAAILNLIFLACFVLALGYIVSLRREERIA